MAFILICFPPCVLSCVCLLIQMLPPLPLYPPQPPPPQPLSPPPSPTPKPVKVQYHPHTTCTCMCMYVCVCMCVRVFPYFPNAALNHSIYLHLHATVVFFFFMQFLFPMSYIHALSVIIHQILSFFQMLSIIQQVKMNHCEATSIHSPKKKKVNLKQSEHIDVTVFRLFLAAVKV